MKKVFSFVMSLFLIVVTYKNGVVEKYEGDYWKQQKNLVIIYKQVKTTNHILSIYEKLVAGINVDLIKKIETVD